MLQHRPVLRLVRCTHLHFRMHLLHCLCDSKIKQYLPELQWRTRCAATQACGKAREVSSFDRTRLEACWLRSNGMTFTTLLLFCVVALVAIATSNVRILVEHVTKTHHRKCWSPLPLATSEFWFSVLKWVGAAYLAWLGFHLLRSKGGFDWRVRWRFIDGPRHPDRRPRAHHEKHAAF